MLVGGKSRFCSHCSWNTFWYLVCSDLIQCLLWGYTVESVTLHFLYRIYTFLYCSAGCSWWNTSNTNVRRRRRQRRRRMMINTAKEIKFIVCMCVCLYIPCPMHTYINNIRAFMFVLMHTAQASYCLNSSL